MVLLFVCLYLIFFAFALFAFSYYCSVASSGSWDQKNKRRGAGEEERGSGREVGWERGDGRVGANLHNADT